jgi:hypothetical protein
VHHRPLALVFVLAGADYLLWNWSLQGNHDVLALMSGLTLTPLALALLWLLVLNAGHLLGRAAQRPRRATVAREVQTWAGSAGTGSARAGSAEATHVSGTAHAYLVNEGHVDEHGEDGHDALAGESAGAKRASSSSQLAA